MVNLHLLQFNRINLLVLLISKIFPGYKTIFFFFFLPSTSLPDVKWQNRLSLFNRDDLELLYIRAQEQFSIQTDHQSHFLPGKIALVTERNRGGVTRSGPNTGMITSNSRARFKISFLIKALSPPNEKSSDTNPSVREFSPRHRRLRRSPAQPWPFAPTHVVTSLYYTILMATNYLEIIFINFALR